MPQATDAAEPPKALFCCTATSEVVCPHCGHEHSDSWEIGHHSDSSSVEMECHECEKKFSFERETDVTYNSFIPAPKKPKRVPPVPPADLRYQVFDLDLAAQREGEFRVADAYVDVWEENCNDQVQAAMVTVMQGLLAVLHRRGFAIEREPSVLARSAIIANDYWYGKRGDLEVQVEHTGRVVKAEFYQSLNVDNPNGGKYDSRKHSRMPRTMQLECIVELAELAKRLSAHGYTPRKDSHLATDGPLLLQVRDAVLGKGPVDPVERYRKSSDWYRRDLDESGFMSMKGRPPRDYTDRDGVALHAGDTRYFYAPYSPRGHLMRGTVYPGNNGSWYVADLGTHVPVGELFAACDDNTPRRLVPGQAERLHRELEKALQAKAYRRVATLGGVLARMVAP